MSGDEEHFIGGGSEAEAGRSPESVGKVRGKKANARAKVEGLAGSVPDGTLPQGKTFDQLPLYEMKSVLINRELE
jgi:hypothetical protein